MSAAQTTTRAYRPTWPTGIARRLHSALDTLGCALGLHHWQQQYDFRLERAPFDPPNVSRYNAVFIGHKCAHCGRLQTCDTGQQHS